METQICIFTHSIYKNLINCFICCFSREPVQLSKDIFCKIFEHLTEPKDRANFAMTCHKFNRIFLRKVENGQIWDHRPYIKKIKELNILTRERNKIERSIKKYRCKEKLCYSSLGLGPCCCVAGVTLTMSQICCPIGTIAGKILCYGSPVGVFLGSSVFGCSWCYHERFIQQYESKINWLNHVKNQVDKEYYRLRHEYKQLKKEYQNERFAKKSPLPPVITMEGYEHHYQHGSIY